MKRKQKAASHIKNSGKSQGSNNPAQAPAAQQTNTGPKPAGLGRDVINIGIITIIIFVGIMLASAYVLGPQIKEQSRIYIKEELLEKANLTLKPGEVYVYEYSSGNETNVLTYTLGSSAGCITIGVNEVSGTGVSCIKKDGTDGSGSNVTLMDPTVFMFRPWMLAVEKGWAWDFGLYSNITGNGELEKYTVYEKAETSHFGRQAYVVAVKDSRGSEKVSMIIDAEKKVLLEENGDEYKIRIISAPFPLAQ